MKRNSLFLIVLVFVLGISHPSYCLNVPFYAEEHLHKGNDYFSQQKYDEAIREYKDAILFAPEYDEAFFRLGYVYMVLNNYEDAKVNFEKAVELRGSYLEAHYCLGQIYSKLKTPDIEKARDHCLKAMDLFGDDTPKLVKLGTYNALGNCYRAQKNYGKAIEYMEKALELNPGQLSTLNNLAVTYVDQQEYEKAKEYYEKAISTDSSYSPAYLGLAGVYKTLGNADAAIRMYQKIIQEIDPNDPLVRKQLGDIFMSQEKYEDALGHFEHLTKLEPKNSNHYNDLGIAYDSLKQYDEAVASFIYARQLNSANPYSLYYLAYVYEHQNNLDKAIETLQENVNQTSSRGLLGRIHFRLAGLNAAKRDEKLAFEHLKSAVELDAEYKSIAKNDPRLKRYLKRTKFKTLLQ